MCLNPRLLNKPYHSIYIPCGHCIECLIQKSNEWAYRCMLESTLHEENCFITLTYNNDYIDESGNLVKADLQKFLKRLRKMLDKDGIKIKYFACGEYGKKHLRPHFHIIIFGWCPNDLQFFSYDNKKQKLFRSKKLEKLWTFGYSSVAECTFESSKYCAKYLNKIDKAEVKAGKVKSFITMSKDNGGIGFNAFTEKMLTDDKIYYRGHYIKVPRYFLDKIAKNSPIEENRVKLLREKRMSIAEAVSWSESQLLGLLAEAESKAKKFKRIFNKSIDKFCKPLYNNDSDNH